MPARQRNRLARVSWQERNNILSHVTFFQHEVVRSTSSVFRKNFFFVVEQIKSRRPNAPDLSSLSQDEDLYFPGNRTKVLWAVLKRHNNYLSPADLPLLPCLTLRGSAITKKDMWDSWSCCCFVVSAAAWLAAGSVGISVSASLEISLSLSCWTHCQNNSRTELVSRSSHLDPWHCVALGFQKKMLIKSWWDVGHANSFCETIQGLVTVGELTKQGTTMGKRFLMNIWLLCVWSTFKIKDNYHKKSISSVLICPCSCYSSCFCFSTADICHIVK